MPDVVIIGAGIHGASAAYHLARDGASVTVVEREFPASGPTGLSSAICRAYYTNRFLAEVARDSIAMFADFEAASGGRDASFRRTGFLYLHPEADAERVRNTTAALNELGIAVDLLTPDDLRSGFPDVNPDGIGIAAFERDAGYADPVGTTTGLLSWAQEHGAEVLNRSRVTAISAGDAGTIELATDGGRTLACDRLLIAAGPWSGALARQLGVDLPLTVERHIVAVAAWGAGERMGYGHIDVAGGYYCRPEGAERFC
ncbi:MAG: FAD-binding oxidoreductase, partial [Chloroflexi bacterium]|nr:FAD-binding oxidoreductase [Chloroflexota bacterium]